MTADFSQLDKLAVSTDKKVEYELFELEGAPLLTVCCAQDNEDYLNKIRSQRSQIERKVRKIQAKQKKSRRLRPTDIIQELMRPVDVECYPGTVVKAWDKNIVDSTGAKVAFTDDNCSAFLAKLPNHIFDPLRIFVADPNNFLDIDDISVDPDEMEEIAGNLRSG